MPNKRPPNAEATQFQTGEEQVEIARQGGVASGKRRREKRAVKEILEKLVNSPVCDFPVIEKNAKKLGLESTKSVKELFVLVGVLNSLKSCDLNTLSKLAEMLGENKPDKTQNNGILNELAKYMKDDANAK